MLPWLRALAVLVSLLDAVGNGVPLFGCNDSQLHLGLEVWLIEAGEDPEAVESLKLRVKVLLVILRVGVGVETNLILVVRRQILESHSVPAL